jgi:hypothetical protein
VALTHASPGQQRAGKKPNQESGISGNQSDDREQKSLPKTSPGVHTFFQSFDSLEVCLRY